MGSQLDLKDVLSTLKAVQVYDYLRVSRNKELLALLTLQAGGEGGKAKQLLGAGERVLFSDSVIKINRRERAQARHLIVTNRALYNFAPKSYSKCKRRIPLVALRALVLSRSSDEIVFVVQDSYDYRYVVQRRAELLEMVSKHYKEAAGGADLPLRFTEEKQLREHVTTKDALRAGEVAPAAVAAAAAAASGGDGDGAGEGGTAGAAGGATEGGGAGGAAGAGSPAPLPASSSASSSSAGGGGAQHPASPAGAVSSPSGGGDPSGGGGGGDASSPSSQQSAAVSGSSSAASGMSSPSLGPSQAPNPPSSPRRVLISKSRGLHARNASSMRLQGALHLPDSSSSVNVGSGGDGVIGCFARDNKLLEGWLTKKKGTSTKWDRKFAILTTTELLYLSPRIKGNVLVAACEAEPYDHLAGADGKKDASSAGGQHISDLGKLFAFEVRSGGRRKKPLRVAADSERARDAWLDAISEDVNEEDREFVHVEGWLAKRESSSGRWRLRYFVLQKDRLWYFEMPVKGKLSLLSGVSAHDAREVQPTESSHSNFAGMTSSTRYAYRFTVSDSHRLYKFGADSSQDMQVWVSEIERASRKHTQGTTANMAAAPAVVPEEMIEAITEEAPEGVVTFVFTDVQSSTTLWEAVPDAMDAALELHDSILRTLLKKFRGYEVKTEGDAFMVTFFSPLDAVRWCLAVQEKLNEQVWPEGLSALRGARTEARPGADGDAPPLFSGIRVRMGIHTGQPNCRRNPVTGRMDYFGPVVNLSARVSDTGHGGQITITDEVHGALAAASDAELGMPPPHVADLGAHTLKGIKEPVRIHEMLPRSLAARSAAFPPIRTMDNERRAREARAAARAAQEAAKAAAAAKAAEAAAAAEEAAAGAAAGAAAAAEQQQEQQQQQQLQQLPDEEEKAAAAAAAAAAMVSNEDEEEDPFFGGHEDAGAFDDDDGTGDDRGLVGTLPDELESWLLNE